jgi:hypothetical protein
MGSSTSETSPDRRSWFTRRCVAVRQAEFVAAPPIYLHVPPGHEKHWSKHCAQYNACGRPVYFVRDEWYNNEYVPHYQHAHDNDHGHGHGHDKHGDHEGHGHHND